MLPFESLLNNDNGYECVAVVSYITIGMLATAKLIMMMMMVVVVVGVVVVM